MPWLQAVSAGGGWVALYGCIDGVETRAVTAVAVDETARFAAIPLPYDPAIPNRVGCQITRDGEVIAYGYQILRPGQIPADLAPPSLKFCMSFVHAEALGDQLELTIEGKDVPR
jgi:hypothetical protein